MPTTRPPVLRLLLPASLTAAGVYALVGCVYIPILGARPRTPDGQDVRSVVGPAGGKRPIRPGVTRDAVLARLGPPQHWAGQGRVAGYDYTVVTGRWFGLCVSDRPSILTLPSKVRTTYLLLLRFDEAGVVEHFEFREVPEWQSGNEWHRFSAPFEDAEPRHRTPDTVRPGAVAPDAVAPDTVAPVAPATRLETGPTTLP